MPARWESFSPTPAMRGSRGCWARPANRQLCFSGNQNIVGNLGILSTPVIDQSTNTLYLVACTLENGTMVYRLHAVDIRSGDELIVAGGTVISGSYGGVTFNSTGVTQRVSLVLAGNQVVFGFGAMEAESSDIGGYVGWVMAYNKSTLQQNGAFATVITGYQGGGVWQSGRPPVVDGAGYVYVFVGNSYGSGGYDGVSDFSESALKLDPSNGLKRIDSFTPGDWLYRDGNDFDLGSSGPLLIPGTSLIVGGGKTGILYLLDTGKMGGESAGDAGAVQVQTVSPWEIRGGPVYWQRSAANNGPLLYICGSWDVLKAYFFNGATFATSPSVEGSVQETWPGGILTLSAYNDTPGTGVLWETVVTSGDAENNPPAPGELLAYDANDVATELWDSTMNASRDGFGNFAKFVPPLVVNGRVYVATQSNQVAVYGLLSTYTTSPSTLAFGSETTGVASTSIPVTVTNTGTVALPITSITVSGANSPLFHETDNCVPSVPAPGTCTINVVFKPTSAGSKTATLNVIVGKPLTATAPFPKRLADYSARPTIELPEGAITPSGQPWTICAASKRLMIVVHVVVLVPFDELLLGMLQGINCLFGVPAEFDSLIVCLRFLNMFNGVFGGCIGIPQIGMMDFISDGRGGEKNG